MRQLENQLYKGIDRVLPLMVQYLSLGQAPDYRKQTYGIFSHCQPFGGKVKTHFPYTVLLSKPERIEWNNAHRYRVT